MRLRLYNKDKDLALVTPWYANKGDQAVVAWLPNGSTFLVEIDGEMVACGSLLLTNSPVVFMEHLVTDPKASELSQGKALRFLAIELEKIAKNLGFAVILGLVPEDHFSLAKFYLRQKAQLGSKLMRVAYKFLGGN
jgi:hypothetical protein